MSIKYTVLIASLLVASRGFALENMTTIQNGQSMETARQSINKSFANVRTLDSTKLDKNNGVADNLSVSTGLTMRDGAGITLGGVTKTSWLQEAMTKAQADGFYEPLNAGKYESIGNTNIMYKSIYVLGTGKLNTNTVDRATWADYANNLFNIQDDVTFATADSNTVASTRATKGYVDAFTTNFNLSGSAIGTFLKFDGSKYVPYSNTVLLATNGYESTSSGKIEQWGKYSTPSSFPVCTTNVVSFPIAFSVVPYNVIVSIECMANDDTPASVVVVCKNITKTNFTAIAREFLAGSQSMTFHWRAIGQ